MDGAAATLKLKLARVTVDQRAVQSFRGFMDACLL